MRHRETVRHQKIVDFPCSLVVILQTMSLPERLRAARAAADITQGDVAEALGCSPNTIANWEKDRSTPCAPDLVKLIRLYGVSADWLLTGIARLPHRFGPPKLSQRCVHGVPFSDRCIACEHEAGPVSP